MPQDNLNLCNLAAARNLAAAGIPIFPAAVYQQEGSNVWQKKPLIRGWQKLATTDLEQIELWWQQHPSAVPAIEVGRAGLVVLDGDRHGGPDGVQALDDVLGTATPAHPVSLTAGGGVHHIFSQPPDVPPLTNQRGSLPPGVDVRGQGGWIVAPGSVRPDGNCYEQKPGTPSLAEAFGNGSIPVIPQRALELITQPAAPARLSKEPPTLADVPAPSVNKPPGNRELAYGRQLLEGSCADVSTPRAVSATIR